VQAPLPADDFVHGLITVLLVVKLSIHLLIRISICGSGSNGWMI
jgi:hypothetical protein